MPFKYRGYTLDPFQRKAMKYVNEGVSVLISAPTGAGKTLVADYAVEKTLKQGRSCIYTSPLKALSNQKYRDFIKLFGLENVGIMTGDVVIRIDAPLLIMTTEVLRNILHRDIGRVSQVEYVIFDELHYLANQDRGTVWEECLILLPAQIKILGLSATVKNVDELASWLTEIKNRPIVHVTHLERPVPLKILGYTKQTGLQSNEKIEQYKDRQLKKMNLKPPSAPVQHRDRQQTPPKKNLSFFAETTHVELIRNITPDYLPCLYFVFSRQGCENYANQLDLDFTTAEEKQIIDGYIGPVLDNYGSYESTHRLCALLHRGIGYHHAGLFPFLKELVETLYELRMVKVLYCTSTFALGVNMPAKTAIFDRLMKYDGKRVRPLTALEFFQKAGRAGRRGMDSVGYVIVNRNLRIDESWIPYNEKDIEPIVSALNLSYNSIINLLEKYSLVEIKKLLSDSLWTYQHRNQILQQEEFLQFSLSDLEEMKGFNLNRTPELVQDHKDILEKELTRLERKKSGLINSLHYNKNRKNEHHLYREIDKWENRIKDITDQKKNVDVLGFIVEMEGRRAPGRKLKKMFSKVRRTQEKILYLRDYLYNVFQEKVKILIDLNFVTEDLQLLSRAEICKYLYIQELFMTILITEDAISDLDELELNALLNCIGQSERKRDFRKKKQLAHPFDRKILRKVNQIHEELRQAGSDRFDPIEFNLQYAYVAYFWSKGYTFSQLLALTDLQEGDVISSFRQTIDILKQLKDVYRNDAVMMQKLNICIDCMDRDVVKVVL